MIRAIAEALKDEISSLNLVDRIEGLVYTAHQMTDSGIKKFPAVCGLGLDECTPNDLVPNDAYCSIIYFEDKGTSGKQGNCHSVPMNTKLRLVCWYDVSKFGNECSYSDLFISYIIQNIMCAKLQVETLSNVRVTVDGIPTRDKGIVFGQYDYSDYVNFTWYPFDFFAIDFDISYEFCKGVTLDTIIKDPNACEPES